MRKSSLDKYGFSDQTVKTVKPIIEAIEQDNISVAEQKLANLALQVCDKVENGLLTPKEGDDYFTLIDLYLDDNYPNLKFKKEMADILFEGMILHDYGKDFGADLNTIRILANKILGQS